MAVYDVEFIARDGNKPTGQEWDAFMGAQRQALEAGSAAGKRLVTVIPVGAGTGWDLTGGGRTNGILLYWEKS
jgi:hypothetical protein